MDEPLSHWLGLREPADVAARSELLTRTIADALPAGEAVCALDLATGTGSNIRYLMDRLPGGQRWLAVDRSAGLLAELRDRMSSFECAIETRQRDLGTLDDREIFAGRDLVTASALLDLVSAQWLRTLAEHCRAAGAAALFTMTYNGRSSCVPAEPEDDLVRHLMNRHQKTDKGLGGPALGPDAVSCAAQQFAKIGYHVEREPSDWTLGPEAADLQRMLIDGWAQAATEMAPERLSTVARWRERRLAHVDAGRSRLVVGHDDLAAWPPTVAEDHSTVFRRRR